jgi:hypothetical protein
MKPTLAFIASHRIASHRIAVARADDQLPSKANMLKQIPRHDSAPLNTSNLSDPYSTPPSPNILAPAID